MNIWNPFLYLKYRRFKKHRSCRNIPAKTVDITIKEHIKSVITDFGDDIVTSVTSPAQRDLFEVDNTREKLDTKKSENYHKIVAKLLHISKRSRLNIQLPVSFLCTRVSCCDVSDWKKLKRVLQYLSGTIDDVLTLGADDITMMTTWVDASYAVHGDMKSHMGGVISFGRGGLFCKSSKQKLNTKSSTKAELLFRAKAEKRVKHTPKIL